MSLVPMDFFPMEYNSPMDRMLSRPFGRNLFDRDLFARDFDRSLSTLAPYWLQNPLFNEVNIGNTVGTVINDREKFGVEIDVTHFRPNEINVNLRDRELVIEGRHDERVHETGRIQRHFVRKYMLPEDVNVETIESHLSDRGILGVWAQKFTGEGKHMRKIPIIAAPRNKPLMERKEDETERK